MARPSRYDRHHSAMVFGEGQSPVTPGSFARRDPELQSGFDDWSESFLAVVKADPGRYHGRDVWSGPVPGPEVGGLVRYEWAAQRSLYWVLSHARSSGLRIRSPWSLQVAWGAPRTGPLGRVRLVGIRVTAKSSGRRASRRHPERSYIAAPTSRGARPGDDWRPGR